MSTALTPFTKEALGLESAWKSFRHHLPRIRMDDSLIGAGVGGALGLGYHGIRSLVDSDEEKKKDPNSFWKRLLLGAGVGAVSGNVVGDRARRYLANNIFPANYSLQLQSKALKPRSWEQVKHTLFKDRPIEELNDPFYQDLREKYGFGTDRSMQGRREMLRRNMGVHTENLKTDIFKSRESDKGEKLIGFNPRTIASGGDVEEMQPNVANTGYGNRFLSNLLGGHQSKQIDTLPSGERVLQPEDIWDVVPQKVELGFQNEIIRDLFSRGWGVLDEPVSEKMVSVMNRFSNSGELDAKNPSGWQDTNKTTKGQYLKLILGRRLLGSVFHKPVTFRQNMTNTGTPLYSTSQSWPDEFQMRSKLDKLKLALSEVKRMETSLGGADPPKGYFASIVRDDLKKRQGEIKQIGPEKQLREYLLSRFGGAS